MGRVKVKYRGYDPACEPCAEYEDACKKHICIRGKRYNYKKCGITSHCYEEAELSTSTNKSSIQLPTLEECVDHVGRFNRNHFVMCGQEQRAIEKCYNFIVRQQNT